MAAARAAAAADKAACYLRMAFATPRVRLLRAFQFDFCAIWHQPRQGCPRPVKGGHSDADTLHHYSVRVKPVPSPRYQEAYT